LDVLAILAFIAYIVLKSLGDRNRQQRERERRAAPRHPLDQQRPLEESPWHPVFEQREKAEEPPAAEVFTRKEAPVIEPVEKTTPGPQKTAAMLEEVKPQGDMTPPVPPQPRRPEVREAYRIEKTAGREHPRTKLAQLLREDNIATAFILSEVLQRPRLFRK